MAELIAWPSRSHVQVAELVTHENISEGILTDALSASTAKKTASATFISLGLKGAFNHNHPEKKCNKKIP